MYIIDSIGLLIEVNLKPGMSHLVIPNYVTYINENTLPSEVEAYTFSSGIRSIQPRAIPLGVKHVCFSEGFVKVPRNALVDHNLLRSLYIPFTAREMREPIIGELHFNCMISIPYGMPLIIKDDHQNFQLLNMRFRIRFDLDNPVSSCLNDLGQFRMRQIQRARDLIGRMISGFPLISDIQRMILRLVNHEVVCDVNSIPGATIIAANHPMLQLPRFIQDYAEIQSRINIQAKRF